MAGPGSWWKVRRCATAAGQRRSHTELATEQPGQEERARILRDGALGPAPSGRLAAGQHPAAPVPSGRRHCAPAPRGRRAAVDRRGRPGQLRQRGCAHRSSRQRQTQVPITPGWWHARRPREAGRRGGPLQRRACGGTRAARHGFTPRRCRSGRARADPPRRRGHSAADDAIERVLQVHQAALGADALGRVCTARGGRPAPGSSRNRPISSPSAVSISSPTMTVRPAASRSSSAPEIVSSSVIATTSIRPSAWARS